MRKKTVYQWARKQMGGDNGQEWPLWLRLLVLAILVFVVLRMFGVL